MSQIRFLTDPKLLIDGLKSVQAKTMKKGNNSSPNFIFK